MLVICHKVEETENHKKTIRETHASREVKEVDCGAFMELNYEAVYAVVVERTE